MNIHPLFVHFPIGILTLYIFFELVRVRVITKQSFYTELKTVLVVLGTVSAFFASITGGLAEELVEGGKNSVVGASMMPLVEQHSLFAGAMTTVFSLLAFSYVFEYCKKNTIFPALIRVTFLGCISTYTQKFAVPLAVVAAVLMFVVGGLGAALVYGPDVDPMVTVIYNIFGI